METTTIVSYQLLGGVTCQKEEEDPRKHIWTTTQLPPPHEMKCDCGRWSWIEATELLTSVIANAAEVKD